MTHRAVTIIEGENRCSLLHSRLRAEYVHPTDFQWLSKQLHMKLISPTSCSCSILSRKVTLP